MIAYTLNREEYYHKHVEIEQWCNQQFGDLYSTDRWQRKFAFGTQFFEFKHEKDAALFALKWL
jgi:hypothetical protein